MPLLRPTAVLTLKDLEEPGFWRKVSLSLPVMGVLTGAGLRRYRAVVLILIAMAACASATRPR